MLLIAVRKMLNNKWMLACTLIGAVITVAMLSCIPIYTDGIMQRMLTKDLEINQQDSGKYAGEYLINYHGAFDKKNEMFYSFDKTISEVIFKSIDIPIATKCTYLNLGSGRMPIGNSKTVYAKLSALSDINDHIKIIHGKIFSNKKAGDTYEVIVSEGAMRYLGLTLGNAYDITNIFTSTKSDNTKPLKIKVVGIYSYKSENDAYWFNNIEAYKEEILMDYSLVKDQFLSEPGQLITDAKWYCAYDYHKIDLDNISPTLSALQKHKKWIEKNNWYLEYKFQAEQSLNQHAQRAKKLTITLLVLQIPILSMLAFYSFMVAKMKIDFESNEIAIIKSRGGSSSLVFMVYLIESLVIGIIALAVGPLLGFFMCNIIGSSNGFLEFVQRSALPLALSPKAYLYSLIAVIFISISMLIPAFSASRTSIVLYKLKNSKNQKSFWKKFYVDFALIAIAIYGFYGYKRQQKLLTLTGAKGTDLEIDPLLFLISVLFVFGCGLLVLRLFPYVVQFIFKLGRRIWNPVFYVTFLGVSRSSAKQQFTMLFIILTLSIGIFSASSARTINVNTEEKVRYQTGADIVVQAHWTSSQANGVSTALGSQTSSSTSSSSNKVYKEPLFKPFTELNGVESVTKVFKKEETNVIAGSYSLYKVPLMAIIPSEFGKTAWFDETLLPYHWYNYLNLMTDSPTAVLVSKAFKEKLKMKEGNRIYFSWGEQKPVSGIIYAFVDYWPTLNPKKMVAEGYSPYFVVANLNYLHIVRSIEPYQVWLKKKPDATSNDIYKSIEDKKIQLNLRTDTTEILVKRKNDPSLQGTNGSLTLGFIVTIIITIIGFLIYWIMSIKKSAFNFGIYRAMGLSSREVMGMIAWEQILVTGTSVLAGVAIGGITSKIFVPMLQLVQAAEEQVPPFKVVTSSSDYIRLFVVMIITLIVCFIVLKRFVSKINIGQAIKLGED